MIIIDYKDRRAIYEQIVDRYKEMILKGVLESDSQIPSVRNLAIELSINPNTIQRAYTELEKQGYIYSVKGKGSFIAANTSLIVHKREEILDGVFHLAKEAKTLGITKEQILIKVKEGFGEESNND